MCIRSLRNATFGSGKKTELSKFMLAINVSYMPCVSETLSLEILVMQGVEMFVTPYF